MALKAGYKGIKKVDSEPVDGSVNPISSGGVYDAIEGIGGLPDYSTEEQNTGQKWVNGKDIYSKTFIFDRVTSTTMSLGSLTGFDEIIKIEGILDSPVGEGGTITSIDNANVTVGNNAFNVKAVYYDYWYKDIRLSESAIGVVMKGHVTVYYTKEIV